MPLEPEHLDYEGTQFLVIGEGLGSFGKAVEEMSKDKKDDGKEKPEEEMEKLEEEVSSPPFFCWTEFMLTENPGPRPRRESEGGRSCLR